jgi:hypothetical protein
MRRSSGVNRQAWAPYTRVPPAMVAALLLHAPSAGPTVRVRSPMRTERGFPSVGGPVRGSSPEIERALRRWSVSSALVGQSPASSTSTVRPDAASASAATPPPAPEPTTIAS